MRNTQAIVTIVTNDYFHHAILLGRSVKRFEKETDFVVFVIDYDKKDPDYKASGFTVLDAKILNPEKWQQFVFQYNGLSASCALKPQALNYLLTKYEKVIYLDSDMKMFQALENGWAALNEASLSLTPHNINPIKNDGYEPHYLTIRISGIFN